MVDYDTYRELHPDAAEFTGESRDDIGEMGMDEENPPNDGLDLIFPREIVGFSIQDKKWSECWAPSPVRGLSNTDARQKPSWSTTLSPSYGTNPPSTG